MNYYIKLPLLSEANDESVLGLRSTLESSMVLPGLPFICSKFSSGTLTMEL